MTITEHHYGDARGNCDVAPTWSQHTETLVSANFSSPEAVVRWLADNKDGAWEWYGWENAQMPPSFFGHVSYDQACDMVLNGWKTGADKAAAMRDRIATANPVERRIARYSVAGALPDVPRYLSGNPRNMRQMDTVDARRKPVITLISHIGAPSSVQADNMLRRAAVVCAVVDAIETAGFSVHLIGWCVSKTDGLFAETSVILKEAGQSVDIARLAFGLGHPAMLRRLGFAQRCACRELRPLGSGLGHTVYEGLASADGAYLIPAISLLGENNFASDKLAETAGLAAITKALKSQGCPAFIEHY